MIRIKENVDFIKQEFKIYIYIIIFYRFYDAMPGNAWLINATAYGHGDALEQFFVDAIGESQ